MARLSSSDPIPVIDLFAGPGGLGEGFSSFKKGKHFRVVLSIEKDEAAHRTLTMRSFFRQFPPGGAPAEYYAYLRGEIDTEQLFRLYPQQVRKAEAECLRAELGVTSNRRIYPHIEKALNDTAAWVLIGGPPCQAYSLVGRSRMRRVERREFEKDKKHYMYREYLRIIARFQPPVFVMENVKGLLSSKIKGSPIFTQILEDLSAPRQALRGGFGTRRRAKTPRQYRIYSLTVKQAGHTPLEPSDFVVRAEQFGIPQKRHRVILVGIRSDIERPGSLTLKSQPETAAGGVLRDLPALRSQLSDQPDSADAWRTCFPKALKAGIFSTDRKVARKVRAAVASMKGVEATGGRFVRQRSKRRRITKRLRRWLSDRKLEGVCNHESRPHIHKDLLRYMFVSCFGAVHGYSPRLCKFPKQLLPVHKNVPEAIEAVYGNFSDRFRVQLRDEPATTVTSHMARDGHYFIHHDPRQSRSWTVREAARIQAFPDNYFFEGNRTEQYRQVGNAVPPLLARQIAAKVADVLRAFVKGR